MVQYIFIYSNTIQQCEWNDTVNREIKSKNNTKLRHRRESEEMSALELLTVLEMKPLNTFQASESRELFQILAVL